ncbi:MAG: phosphate acyltransferase PlsX [Fusobacteriaceae bacterium]
MKIALDAMGGDNAPYATVKGAILALEEFKDIELILVGQKNKLEKELEKYKYDKNRLIIHQASEVIEMEDDPIVAVRGKKDSSMNVTLELVKRDLASAAVSAGNTGALITASQLKLKRIKGVLRPAIATVFPNKKDHMVVLDVGANSDCKPEFLDHFAILGSKYAEILLGIKNPRVGLLNIGSEDGKGNELTRASFDILSNQKKINFVGNIEPHKMLNGDVDVIVTDGYTGNILLKSTEGTAKFIIDFLKNEIRNDFIFKIGAFFLRSVFRKLRKKMDASEYGGAIFLGLNHISIKAHGGSDERAIKNAIRAAKRFVEEDFVEKIKTEMEKISEKKVEGDLENV